MDATACTLWNDATLTWEPASLRVLRGAAVVRQQTFRYADVVVVEKSVSYWLLPNALTLTLSEDGATKAHVAALVQRDAVYDVLTHFWASWWAAVLEVRQAKLGGGLTRITSDSLAAFTDEERRRLQIVEMTTNVLAGAAVELHQQTEQIDNVHQTVSNINAHLLQTDRLLTGIGSWLPMSKAAINAPAPPASTPASATAPSASPALQQRRELAQAILQHEADGSPDVLHLQPNATYRARRIRCDKGVLTLVATPSGAPATTVAVADVASVQVEHTTCTITLTLRNTSRCVLMSARLLGLAEWLRERLPIAQTPAAGAPRQRRQFGTGASSAGGAAVVWTETLDSDRTAQAMAVGGQQALFADSMVAKLDDVKKIAVAMGATLDDQLHTIDAIERDTDTASQRLQAQTRRARNLAQ